MNIEQDFLYSYPHDSNNWPHSGIAMMSMNSTFSCWKDFLVMNRTIIGSKYTLF
jgi:hypothetical protein